MHLRYLRIQIPLSTLKQFQNLLKQNVYKLIMLIYVHLFININK